MSGEQIIGLCATPLAMANFLVSITQLQSAQVMGNHTRVDKGSHVWYKRLSCLTRHLLIIWINI